MFGKFRRKLKHAAHWMGKTAKTTLDTADKGLNFLGKVESRAVKLYNDGKAEVEKAVPGSAALFDQLESSELGAAVRTARGALHQGEKLAHDVIGKGREVLEDERVRRFTQT